ncbi:hypothetical protein NCG89_00915 [Spongiibacter taiwanensis]|uniref:hypothetical protein n=1 Tax=Spongiibacter taiwanensis TaxID=1748242 RepID=UPI002035A424|nr:hypothetical protein [Spongiibacter taiwanensis]USA43364.1 hypothetical protein NCG89_00915 [Spongiibacter taiwanensis]
MKSVKIFSSKMVTNSDIRRQVFESGGYGEPIVVYGPQACGKTRNAEAVAKYLNRPVVIDDYLFERSLPDGCVALTYLEPPQSKPFHGFRAIKFSDIEGKI